MLETATTTEMQGHFACAHAHRAAAFRLAVVRLGEVLQWRPRLDMAPRVPDACGCA